ncbi:MULTISPECIES: winged helix-turn-helix domain-containing protein [unclassified Streptomyces]|uniref:winged helix-turn-helix domain-containing protein n=1 Tax=unclassified Streptomyces TaxID=2593676 RepID=UPI0022525356|nr:MULTISPECIES: winged helix-turn-helix domain-containing protein [unclassified Streptomyces]MCX5060641.1 winged helix-turn-helix domain-containing protein [Streptomyces sp. NBC_00452]MCX5422847.1 winged helix-turn-helix domain-containing protein [Streptomyces sp. NBC_00078]
MAADRDDSPIDPHKIAYVYMQVADHIAARIASGELRPGARLAGERDMGAEYGVAYLTARRAVRELRERGLVVTLPAKGTFVAYPDEAAEPAGDGQD